MTIHLKYIVLIASAFLAFLYLLNPKPVAASSNNVLSGKCVAMSTTSSFLMENSSEKELNWIGILDFSNSKYSAIISEVNRADLTNISFARKNDFNRDFYIHSDELPGAYKMTFNPDPNSSDFIILIPGNSNNIIFMMDPIMGSTGVCQKIWIILIGFLFFQLTWCHLQKNADDYRTEKHIFQSVMGFSFRDV